jgi:hemerythrin
MTRHLSKIEWNDEMSVGIAEIDAGQKRFISLINEFIRAIEARMGLLEIGIRLQLVLEFAEHHFAEEEKLFREWRYLHTTQHENKNSELLQAVHDIMEKAKTYSFDSEWRSAELAIKNLLVLHVQEEYMKYADFLHKHHGVPKGNHKRNKAS